MQIFELHFNPGAKEDLIFDSFCYEAENIFERRVGNLYMVGLLKSSLPQNSRFLDKLAKIIKEKFYGFSAHSPEKALREGLKKANEFLEKIAREGDVSWLGNLGFAVISLKNFDLNFTKVGNLKILLLRNGGIVDIDKNLDLQGIEPYPLKIFSNIIAGNLTEEDKILVFTEEVFQLFSSENILSQISQLIPFDEKGLKKILKQSEEKLLKISGTCLIIKVTKESQIIRPFTFKKEPEKFLISRIFAELGENILKNLSSMPKKIVKAISPIPLLKRVRIRPRLTIKIPNPFNRIKNIKIIPKITLPSFKLPTEKSKITSAPSPKKIFRPAINFRSIFSKNGIKLPKKNIISVLGLILILLAGFIIFGIGKNQEIKLAQQTLEEIKLKKVNAENLLIFNDKEGANNLFQEAWNELLPQTKIGSPIRNEALSLQNLIEEDLAPLNNLEKISDPELTFEFNLQKTELIPQKLLSFGDNLYFFNQLSPNLYKLNVKDKSDETLKANSSLKAGGILDDSVLFFSKSQLFILKNNEWQTSNLQLPAGDFNFDYLSVFRGNLYFLDTKSGEIIKYPYLGNFSWGTPQVWLNPSDKTTNAKSMTVDGSIWILTKENSVERYYAGIFQEKLDFKFFPYPKDFSKIFIDPALPYLYILEPIQKRIIILYKNGDIVKQFQSEKFDNLMDFAITNYGRTIYLLNGSDAYKISL